MSEFRYGNIVYYEDVPGCGYPICFNKQYWPEDRLASASFDVPVKNDGHRDIFIKPMEFNFDDFWSNNTHLKCSKSDLPGDIKHLHEFQNWYEDKFGEQPRIMRGNHALNEVYFKYK